MGRRVLAALFFVQKPTPRNSKVILSTGAREVIGDSLLVSLKTSVEKQRNFTGSVTGNITTNVSELVGRFGNMCEWASGTSMTLPGV